MKQFALIGVGGYIAPRHMRAISDTGNNLVAAVDKNDSVGIIDSYFPKADFFTEFERFDRHIEMLRRDKRVPVDYVSICSPNYLHDAHIRFALRVGANAICEKPLVLNPWNVDALASVEKESGRKVSTILQLRLHPTLLKLKREIESDPDGKIFDVDLTYITPRGQWYLYSWKGDTDKSGGIATNIGIHFFDLLIWIFGPVKQSVVHVLESTRGAGYLELRKARVRWFLSINHKDLPFTPASNAASTYRSIVIDGKEIEFSSGFTDLHTQSYVEILNGNGFGIEEARACVELAHSIRESHPAGCIGDYHPMLRDLVKSAGNLVA